MESLRKNELEVITLLSGMIRQYREINNDITLENTQKLIIKTSTELLDLFEKPESN